MYCDHLESLLSSCLLFVVAGTFLVVLRPKKFQMIFSSLVELMWYYNWSLFFVCFCFFFFPLNSSGLFESNVLLFIYFLCLNSITIVWHRMEGGDLHRKDALYVVVFLVEGDEKSCDPSQGYNVTWYLRYSDCYNEVFNFGVRTVWKMWAVVFFGLSRFETERIRVCLFTSLLCWPKKRTNFCITEKMMERNKSSAFGD